MLEKFAYSIRDVSQMASLSRVNIYKALKKGDLSAKTYGRRTLVLRSELLRFLDELNDYLPAQKQ